jgi:hypothetical protein
MSYEVVRRMSMDRVLCLALPALIVLIARSATAQTSQESTLCQFVSGPRAGETQDYAPLPALPVGYACQDGAGSTGRVIARKSTGSSGESGPTKKSTLCQFTSGPRAGETQDYAPMDPLPVGSACQDGVASKGKVIPNQKDELSGKNSSLQKSTLCQFTSGPRVGETQDYAPQAPLLVGSACQDGSGSTGKVIAAKRQPQE